MTSFWRRFILPAVVVLLTVCLAEAQTIHYDSGYTWRGYTGTVAPTCPSKLCHHYAMTTIDSFYYEYTAWKSTTNNPNTASAFVNFRVIFPVGYNMNDATKTWPLIVMLHGAGESGRVWTYHYNYTPSDSTYDNNGHQLKHGGPQHKSAVYKPASNTGSFPGIVVFPQTSYNGVWGDTTATNLSDNEKMLIGFIEDQLVARYRVDPNRIVMHGLSNGAKSVWSISQKRPDLFAAILPMSGVPYNKETASTILLTTPVRLFQGGQDINPTPSAAQQVINSFVAKGGNPQLFLYPELGHGTWNKAYNEPDFFSWIRAQDKRKIYVFGGSTEICNDPLKFGISAGMLAYQWTKNGADIVGAQSRYLANVGSVGAYTVKFLRPNGQWDESFPVTVTLGTGCSGVSKPVLSAGLNKTVCSDAASGIILDDDGSGVNAATFNITAINYNGLVASAGSPATGTGLSSIAISDDAYTNITAAAVNVVYTVVPVSSSGNAGDPANVTLTVNPKPVLKPVPTTSRCSGVASGITLDDNGSGVNAATFNISGINFNGLTASAGNPTADVGFPATVIADDAYANNGLAVVNVVYTVVPVSSAFCTGSPSNVTMSVSPAPVLSAALSTTKCSDLASGIMLDDNGSSVNAASFNINAINSGGLTPSAGAPAAGNGLASGVIVDDAYTNIGAIQVNVMYTIAPVSGAGCVGNPGSVILTVNPEPVLSTALNATICSEITTGITLDDNGTSVNASTFNITAINFNGLTASGGAPATGNGLAGSAISDDAYANVSTASATVVYTVVPISTVGCLGNAGNVGATVKPKPVLSAALDVTRCSDVPAGITLDDNGSSVNAVTFNVTAINFNGLSASAGSPVVGNGLSAVAINDDAYTNVGTSPVDVIYTVAPVSSLACTGNAGSVKVTVNPKPVLSSTLGATRTSGEPSGIVLDDSGTGVNASSFNITSINMAGLTASAGAPATGNGLSPTVISDDAFTNSGGAPVNVTYMVAPVSAATCVGTAASVILKVNPVGSTPPPPGQEPPPPGQTPPPPGQEPPPPGGSNPPGNGSTPPDSVVTGVNRDPDLMMVGGGVAYPNPTTGRVVVSLNEPIGEMTFYVLNSAGQAFLAPAKSLGERSVEFDLSELSQGLYILRVKGRSFKVVKH